MKHLYHYLLLCLCALTVTACSDDDKEELAEQLNPLVVSEAELSHSVECDKATVQIHFTAAAKWTVTVLENADWIYPDRSSGQAGEVTLNVTLTANGTNQARTGTLRIACGTASQDVSFSQAANQQGEEPEEPTDKDTMNSNEIEDFDKYYKPEEFANINMLKRNAKWSWFRSKQSPHFFVFWESGFGDDPNSEKVPANLRVDIDDLLAKAEQFYKTNIETLKFADLGQGKSYLDQYKMQIYLLYQEEWLATGSGYDNKIGALWVNPSTCQPVGSTIAHEIGHSFQYQVYCDKLCQGGKNDYQSGFRYGYEGSNGGNGFWEQCAQWQSYQDYPEQLFYNYHFDVWLANCHRHFEHEWMRYASYWLQYYWTAKHGIDAVAHVWKESVAPEDAIGAYTRLYNGGSWETTKKELFDYAQRMATFDIDVIRDYSADFQGRYSTKLYSTSDGYCQVAYASCPAPTGFNVIALNLPETGNTVSVDFEGLAAGSALAADDPGEYMESEKAAGKVSTYNAAAAGQEGWAYGFVAMKDDGSRAYGEMNTQDKATATFEVPEGTQRLYLVVQGSPKSHRVSPWDEKELTDDQLPYKIKLHGTDLLGSFNIDTDAAPTDLELSYDLKCDASLGEYVQGSIDLQANGDIRKIAQAFVMQPTVLSGNTLAIAANTTVAPEEGKVAFGLLQPDGSTSYSYTSNAGFYCKADGSVGSWNDSDPLWVEYDRNNFVITYGHYPGKTEAGKSYTLKPVLVYTNGGTAYKVTFTLNLKF